MKKFIPFLIAPMTIAANISLAAEKHVHGEAELYIAVQGKQVSVELASPADNLLGFEHKPRTAKQKQALESVEKALADYRKLIEFAGASCQLQDANVDLPFGHDEHHDDHHDHDHGKKAHKKHDDHGHDDHDHGDHEEETHSSFSVTYQLTCNDLTKAEVTAFKHFSGFEKIQVNWVLPQGQGSQQVTTAKNTIDF